MFYKNWPYWLKGGVIGVTISLIFFVLMMVVPDSVFESMGKIFELIIMAFAMPIGLAGFLLIWGSNGPPDFLNNVVLQIILDLLFWFLIGALISKIYYKMNKNNS